MTVVTLRALKLPLDSDTMFQLKTPLPPVPPSPETLPPQSPATQKHQELFITSSPPHMKEYLSVFLLSPLSLPRSLLPWRSESMTSQVCACLRVCLCAEMKAGICRLNEHSQRISGDEQKHRQQASSWSVHTNTHAHMHTSSYGPSPTHSPTHTCTTNQSVTHPVTHSQTNGQEKLIGLMMITAHAFQNACTVMLAICNFKYKSDWAAHLYQRPESRLSRSILRLLTSDIIIHSLFY